MSRRAFPPVSNALHCVSVDRPQAPNRDRPLHSIFLRIGAPLGPGEVQATSVFSRPTTSSIDPLALHLQCELVLRSDRRGAGNICLLPVPSSHPSQPSSSNHHGSASPPSLRRGCVSLPRSSSPGRQAVDTRNSVQSRHVCCSTSNRSCSGCEGCCVGKCLPGCRHHVHFSPSSLCTSMRVFLRSRPAA